MRKIIKLIVCLIASGPLHSQVSVNTDGSPPHSSAMFEVKSSNKGFLPPRMSWPQIQAIQGPVAGLVVYDEGIRALRMYDGNKWIVIGAKEYGLSDPPGNFSTFNGITTGNSTGTSVTIGADKKVYVTGYFDNMYIFGDDTLTSAGGNDIFWAVFDSSGNYLWSRVIGGTGYSYPRNIEVDALGNIYIIGEFDGTVDFDPGPGTDNHTFMTLTSFFAKYDPNGNLIWAKHIAGTVITYIQSMAIESTGNIFICGNLQGTADFDPGPGTFNLTTAGVWDNYFAKYDAGGNFVWVKKTGGIAHDFTDDIIIVGGTLVMTGLFSGTVDFDPNAGVSNLTSAGTSDYFFARYDIAGNFLWGKAIGTPVAETTINMSLGSDLAGNIVVGGLFSGTIDINPDAAAFNLTSAGGRDFFVAKYSSAGSFLSWGLRIGGLGDDGLYNLVIDGTDNLWMVGDFSGTVDFDYSGATQNLVATGFSSAFLAKYDPSANFVFAKSLGGTGGATSHSVAAIASGKLIFCTGNASAPFLSFNGEKITSNGFFLSRYEQ